MVSILNQQCRKPIQHADCDVGDWSVVFERLCVEADHLVGAPHRFQGRAKLAATITDEPDIGRQERLQAGDVMQRQIGEEFFQGLTRPFL